MGAINKVANCTASSKIAAQACCARAGALWIAPNNKCFRTNTRLFTTCVESWNAQQMAGLHANTSILAATTAGAPSSNSTSPKIGNNATKHPDFHNATVQCWDRKKGTAARRARKQLTLGSIALIVTTLATYTAM